MSFLKKILMVPVEREEGDFNTYLSKLDSGAFKDRMFYGIAEDRRGFLIVDPVQQPGALYCGGMGSGKSVAMRSTLITHMAANSENTIYLLVDTLKGMTDYAVLFDYDKNVATALNDPAKLIPVIEMVYQECMARKEEFSRVNASNIYEYEKIMKKQDPNYPGLARIILAMEEFHAVPNAEVIKYHMNVDRNGSPAAMLKDLLRVGRSYGISLLAASQRATSDDFPSSLKPGITQLMAFRVNNPGDATAINLPMAADIRMEQRGRCAYEGGFIQFPYIDDNTGKAILKKYYKPLKAKLLRYNMDQYQLAFSGEGNQGLVKVKTLKSLVENFNSFKLEDIATRVLEAFDFKVSSQSNKALSVNLIAERAGIRYGVMLLQGRSGGSKKSVEAFKEGAKILECESIIAICIDGMIPSEVSAARKEMNGYDLDVEDLSRIANILDNKEQLVRENKFDQLFNKLPLVPLKGEVDPPAQIPNANKTPGIAAKAEPKNEIDELFAQFQSLGTITTPDKKPETPVEAKPAAIEAPKEVKKEASMDSDLGDLLGDIKPVKASETVKTEVVKDETKAEARPQAATGGSNSLVDLRERLKTQLKGKV